MRWDCKVGLGPYGILVDSNVREESEWRGQVGRRRVVRAVEKEEGGEGDRRGKRWEERRRRKVREREGEHVGEGASRLSFASRLSLASRLSFTSRLSFMVLKGNNFYFEG